MFFIFVSKRQNRGNQSQFADVVFAFPLYFHFLLLSDFRPSYYRILILTPLLKSTNKCSAGVSLKMQQLRLLFFLARYVDLPWTTQLIPGIGGSYLQSMKIVLILLSLVTVRLFPLAHSLSLPLLSIRLGAITRHTSNINKFSLKY